MYQLLHTTKVGQGICALTYIVSTANEGQGICNMYREKSLKIILIWTVFCVYVESCAEIACGLPVTY